MPVGKHQKSFVVSFVMAAVGISGSLSYLLQEAGEHFWGGLFLLPIYPGSILVLMCFPGGAHGAPDWAYPFACMVAMAFWGVVALIILRLKRPG
jgi:hypothetical protein